MGGSISNLFQSNVAGGFGSQGGLDFSQLLNDPGFNLGLGLLGASAPQTNANLGSRFLQAAQFANSRQNSILNNQLRQARLDQLTAQQRAQQTARERLTSLGRQALGGGSAPVSNASIDGLLSDIQAGGGTGTPFVTAGNPQTAQQGIEALLGGVVPGSIIPGNIPTGGITGINPSAQDSLSRASGQSGLPRSQTTSGSTRSILDLLSPRTRQIAQVFANQGDFETAGQVIQQELTQEREFFEVSPGEIVADNFGNVIIEGQERPIDAGLFKQALLVHGAGGNIGGLPIPDSVKSTIRGLDPTQTRRALDGISGGTTVNVSAGDTQAQRNRANRANETIVQAQAGGQLANESLPLINQLDQLNESIIGGPGSGAKQAIAQLARTFGLEVDVGGSLSDTQVFNTIVNRLTQDRLNAAKGPQTDLDFVRNRPTRASNTRAARAMQIVGLRRLAQRQAQLSQQVQQFLATTDLPPERADTEAARLARSIQGQQAQTPIFTEEERAVFTGRSSGGTATSTPPLRPSSAPTGSSVGPATLDQLLGG